MVTWNNLDTLASYQNLFNEKRVNIAEAMTGENGAERVRKYSIPMAAGLAYNFAAKQVDESRNGGKMLTPLLGNAASVILQQRFCSPEFHRASPREWRAERFFGDF